MQVFLEKIIKKFPRLAVSYASKVLKKRWFDAEIYIADSSKFMYHYSMFVCNGKLPEILHNKMEKNKQRPKLHGNLF